MALKHKIIAVFFIIIAIFFFFYFRKKPDHPILKPFATVTKNDRVSAVKENCFVSGCKFVLYSL